MTLLNRVDAARQTPSERSPHSSSKPAGRWWHRGAQPGRTGAAWWRRYRADFAVAVLFLLAGWYVQSEIWAGQYRYPGTIGGDADFFAWCFAHAARLFTDPENPLFTDRLNVPDGINLMANTSVLGIGIPLAPVTLLFGPHASYTLAITLGLAGTAYGWYWLLSRHVVGSKLAGVIGGALAGFGPTMVSHANGHVNFTAQFLVPIIVWRILKLREPGHAVRNGLILAAIATYQFFIGAEVLFFTALGTGVFLLGYLAAWPRAGWQLLQQYVRPFAAALGVTALTMTLLLSYPLWFQFFGPQHYHGVPAFVNDTSADLASYPAFARLTLAGDARGASAWALNPTEEDTLFGWPLLILIVAIVVWRWRDPVVRALAIVASTFALLSLGSPLMVNGHNTHIPLPWHVLRALPLFDAALPARFGLVVLPALAVLVACAVAAAQRQRGAVRWVWTIAIAAALIPIVPTPIPGHSRPDTPEFLTSDAWRPYVRDGRTLVTIPLPDPINDAMRWQAEQRLDYAMPRGYFLGPGGPEGRAMFNAPARPTSDLIYQVLVSNQVPPVGPQEQANAHADLQYWQADLVVLPAHPNEAALRGTVEALLGPGQRHTDVWIWDVRWLERTKKP